MSTDEITKVTSFKTSQFRCCSLKPLLKQSYSFCSFESKHWIAFFWTVVVCGRFLMKLSIMFALFILCIYCTDWFLKVGHSSVSQNCFPTRVKLIVERPERKKLGQKTRAYGISLIIIKLKMICCNWLIMFIFLFCFLPNLVMFVNDLIFYLIFDGLSV